VRMVSLLCRLGSARSRLRTRHELGSGVEPAGPRPDRAAGSLASSSSASLTGRLFRSMCPVSDTPPRKAQMRMTMAEFCPNDESV
jgi:hypothetical protein